MTAPAPAADSRVDLRLHDGATGQGTADRKTGAFR